MFTPSVDALSVIVRHAQKQRPSSTRWGSALLATITLVLTALSLASVALGQLTSGTWLAAAALVTGFTVRSVYRGHYVRLSDHALVQLSEVRYSAPGTLTQLQNTLRRKGCLCIGDVERAIRIEHRLRRAISGHRERHGAGVKTLLEARPS